MQIKTQCKISFITTFYMSCIIVFKENTRKLVDRDIVEVVAKSAKTDLISHESWRQ